MTPELTNTCRDFLRDGQGKPSSMRLLSLVVVVTACLALVAQAIAPFCGKPVPDLSIPISVAIGAAFGGKATQKFVRP